MARLVLRGFIFLIVRSFAASVPDIASKAFCSTLVDARFQTWEECDRAGLQSRRNMLIWVASRNSWVGRADYKDIVSRYQAMPTQTLMGVVANLATLMQTRRENSDEIRGMTDSGQRNAMIDELHHCLGVNRKTLQASHTWTIQQRYKTECQTPRQLASDASNDECVHYTQNTHEVNMRPCQAGLNQQWVFTDGLIKEMSQRNCLQLADAARGSVGVAPCSGDARQEWIWKGRQLSALVKNGTMSMCLEHGKENDIRLTVCQSGQRQQWGWIHADNIELQGGLEDNALRFLSSSGRQVGLVNKDDGSGRQKWSILDKGAYSNIVVFGGNGNKRYLSTSSVNGKVELADRDLHSERQKWTVQKNKKEGWYSIQAKTSSKYLGAALDGQLGLVPFDDESNRQRWYVAAGAFEEAKRGHTPKTKLALLQKPKSAKKKKKWGFVKSYKKFGWKVLKGKCSIDISNKKRPCVVSPGYPGKYATEENCQLDLNLKHTKAVKLDKYGTEQYFDYLKVDGTSYSGMLTGKKIFLKTSKVTWSADFFLEGKGWKLCRHNPMKGLSDILEKPKKKKYKKAKKKVKVFR
mmetsp:Transcript_103056/g.204582  ORF Transcript_103056/g.204582 Transcript_103056/m.204582 type:complete len:578 (+) Transcript_103056:67-1800(+)